MINQFSRQFCGASPWRLWKNFSFGNGCVDHSGFDIEDTCLLESEMVTILEGRTFFLIVFTCKLAYPYEFFKIIADDQNQYQSTKNEDCCLNLSGKTPEDLKNLGERKH